MSVDFFFFSFHVFYLDKYIRSDGILTREQTAEARLALEFDLELRPQGVPFLVVHPGLVKTDMNQLGNITVDTSTSGL
jgi:hypothetical protein